VSKCANIEELMLDVIIHSLYVYATIILDNSVYMCTIDDC
jgi:hypothetical protein